ncbi:MAG: hypothetical protein J1F25_08130, partial [Prevotellaceae bacterium]|nr:hypothetical protein [Prevotellaceae bacterium]
MKKIKTYHLHSAIATIAGIAMGITLWSCSDTIEQDGVNPNMPCIELSFANESTSRADESVLGFTQTEKQMNTVDVFFYTKDKTTPVKVVHIDNTAHDAKHNIYIPGDSVEIIFGPEESADRTCRIYTVVNVSKAEYEKAGITKEDATISQLRNLKATTATFATTFNGFAMFTKSETGDVVTYDAQARRAAGVIKVKNLAAKIDLYANFGGEDGTVEGIDPTGTVQGTTKWKIYKGTSNEAFIIDGVQSVPMNGWSLQDYTDGNLTKSLNGDDYFDTRTSTVNHYFKSSNETDKEKYPWVIAEPFYSYPNQWSADALEQHQTYLMLKVNWLPFETDENAPNVEDEIVETYYKIPINVSAGESKDKLLSNMYYRVKVNINTLGGINYGEPVELEDCSWEVLPWSEARLDADIHEIRWLEIKQKQTDVYDGQTYQAIMNNTSSVTLSYNSTHSIYLKSIKIQYYNFQTN